MLLERSKKTVGPLLIGVVLLLFSIVLFTKWAPRQYQNYKYEQYKLNCRNPRTLHRSFMVPVPKGFAAHGFDISHFCCPVNWRAVKKMKVDSIQMQFVYLRATMGQSGYDMEFNNNWQGAKMVGLSRGAYHFFYPEQDAAAQAYHFLEQVKHQKGDLPPVLDLEKNDSGLSPTEVRKRMEVWLQIVEKETKTKPVIYVNRNYYETYIQGFFAAYPLWLAAYNMNRPPVLTDGRQWLLWQHSAKASVDGVAEPVDLIVVNGGVERLLQLAKK